MICSATRARSKNASGATTRDVVLYPCEWYEHSGTGYNPEANHAPEDPMVEDFVHAIDIVHLGHPLR
jgi:hypothetical protein